VPVPRSNLLRRSRLVRSSEPVRKKRRAEPRKQLTNRALPPKPIGPRKPGRPKPAKQPSRNTMGRQEVQRPFRAPRGIRSQRPIGRKQLRTGKRHLQRVADRRRAHSQQKRKRSRRTVRLIAVYSRPRSAAVSTTVRLLFSSSIRCLSGYRLRFRLGPPTL
jgi:hypothetical protein